MGEAHIRVTLSLSHTHTQTFKAMLSGSGSSNVSSRMRKDELMVDVVMVTVLVASVVSTVVVELPQTQRQKDDAIVTMIQPKNLPLLLHLP